MAPTIGRQRRGGSQDYAALCDYCDVRYLRSQLRKQGNGRLACIGPGTNSCGAGLDEVSLDKINADIMRHRRKPTKHAGGRFDRLRTSIEDIFGASLVEYWDAAKGIMSHSSGSLFGWTGQKLGLVLVRESFGPGQAAWHSSHAAFHERPVVEVTFKTIQTTEPPTPFLPAGARPYIAIVAVFPPVVAPTALSSIGPGAFACLKQTVVQAQMIQGGSIIAASYESAAGPAGASLPVQQIGSQGDARVFVLDATGPLTFRAGAASAADAVDSPTANLWDRIEISEGMVVTLIVIANAPTAAQVAEFEALAESYRVRLP